MPILHIEHSITDLDTWLTAFRKFAPAREQAGVLSADVYQPTTDPNYIWVNLHFATADAALQFRTFLMEVVWKSPEASPALAGTPRTEILTEVNF
jgi:quinol monooxygenase YgiN